MESNISDIYVRLYIYYCTNELYLDMYSYNKI